MCFNFEKFYLESLKPKSLRSIIQQDLSQNKDAGWSTVTSLAWCVWGPPSQPWPLPWELNTTLLRFSPPFGEPVMDFCGCRGFCVQLKHEKCAGKMAWGLRALIVFVRGHSVILSIHIRGFTVPAAPLRHLTPSSCFSGYLHSCSYSSPPHTHDII